MSLKAIGEAAKGAVKAGKAVHAWSKTPQGQATIGSVKMTVAQLKLKKNPADRGARRTSMNGARQTGEGLGKLAAQRLQSRRPRS